MTTWITPKQAAAMYGVSEAHIRNLCARGELDCMKLGKLWRIRHEEEAPAGATASASASRKETL